MSLWSIFLPSRRCAVRLGSLRASCLLALALVGVFGSSVAFARPVPPGVEGEPVMSAAQQCLETALILDGPAPQDPTHGERVHITVTNHCLQPVQLQAVTLFYYHDCPSTTGAPDTWTTLPAKGLPFIPQGDTLHLIDLHTEHCVACQDGRAVDWPPFSVDVSIIDAYGTTGDPVNGFYVYATHPGAVFATYAVFNGPSPQGDALCLKSLLVGMGASNDQKGREAKRDQ